jgi:cell division protease FtsH
LENKMQVLLGGRAAEHIVFGKVSTGASDDLQKVTSIARSIVMRYGMHEKLGNVVYEQERQSFLGPMGPSPEERRYSEETAREIDCAVRDIVSKAFERTVAILDACRATLEAGAEELLQKETLNEADLQRLRAGLPAAA